LQMRRTVHPAVHGSGVNGANGASSGNGPDGDHAGQIVPLAVQEKHAILSTLDTLKGDKLMAAKVLGIGKTTLYRKLKEYGIGEHASAPGD